MWESNTIPSGFHWIPYGMQAYPPWTPWNNPPVLHHAPLIPAGMNPFHWNPPESAGMAQESTGMGRNGQEWNRNGQEWHWNGLKWTFWS